MSHFSNWQTCNCGHRSEMLLICEGKEEQYPDEISRCDIVYRILKCLNCGDISIYRYSKCWDYYGFSRNILDDEKPFESEILYAPKSPKNEAIPTSIVDVLDQAEDVYKSSPRAGFILCRAVLEEICRERKIPDEGNLAKNLEKLIEQENLSEDLKDILHGIRQLGNEGAHGSQIRLAETITAKEVESLIDLVEYILDRIYVQKANDKAAKEKLNALRGKVLGNT